MDDRFASPRFPRSSAYHPEWILASVSGGANSLWLTEWLAEALDLRPGLRVLELGCGTGGIATKLGTLGFNVLAADVSDNALNACRNAGLAVLDLREEWPDPQSADVVLACDVLEHVEDDGELLAKLREVLRVGGHLVATVPA